MGIEQIKIFAMLGRGFGGIQENFSAFSHKRQRKTIDELCR